MKVSIIMPVYNGAQYLQEAIDSILGQSFSDFEFIIVDDGSKDESVAIIERNALRDGRIVVLHNEVNSGICVTLNKGLEVANGEYILRMDCDDISLPNRIERQVAFMEERKDIAVAGCFVEAFYNDQPSKCTTYCSDTNPDECWAGLLFATSVAHPAVIIRKSILDTYNLRYDDYYRGMEDFYLWWQIAKHANITNVPGVLLRYRLHTGQVTQTQVNEDFLRRQREFLSERIKDLGGDFSDDEIRTVERYLLDVGSFDDNSLVQYIHTLRKLLKSLHTEYSYKRRSLCFVIGKSIAYAYDLSKQNLQKGYLYYMYTAYASGCMTTAFFLKRIIRHYLR